MTTNTQTALSMRPNYLAIAVFLATIAFALSPFLTIGFGGFTQSQFPVVIANPPVQPAGYAFSIWGIIYLWLIFGAGMGVWRASVDHDWHAMRQPLLVSLVIGSFWIWAANISPILATVMIAVMAVCAVLAMLRAGAHDPWIQVRPVALYAGWLTAATGVAIGVTLGGYGILSGQHAAYVCLSLVLVLALFVQSKRPMEWAYPSAIIWALIGVIVANFDTRNAPVLAICVIGIVALVYYPLKSLQKGTR
mgnify:CR=1 FL=1